MPKEQRNSTSHAVTDASARQPRAAVLREYGPFPGANSAHGVTFDGRAVWFATGERLQAFDPRSGRATTALEVRSDAGTAFDGRYFFQIAADKIHKIDPDTGEVIATIPAPGAGRDSGMTWAEGTLWVGEHRSRKIHQIDPDTGRILKTLESDRFVTGVTWSEGALWHGTWEGEECDLRRVDTETGEVLEQLAMPEGSALTGVEAADDDVFYCGDGRTGKVRAVRRPQRTSDRRS